MGMSFAEIIRKLRIGQGLSQCELAREMYVTQSAVARWENGSRLPDAVMMSRLARCLGADLSVFMGAAAESSGPAEVIMVDDNKPILTDGLTVLEEVMPDAAVTGFVLPQEALDYARSRLVALAFLDIELGAASGLDLCNTLLEINPRTNVVFLTAYPDYSLDAWDTGASGFMVKPLTPEGVREQLGKLRYPMAGALGA